MYINKKRIHRWPFGRAVTPLLIYILKHKGYGGDLANIAVNVWGKNEEELRELKKVSFDEETAVARKGINTLNNYLSSHLNTRFETLKTGQYSFNKDIRYCLLEIQNP
jgi:hypothetical protein